MKESLLAKHNIYGNNNIQLVEKMLLSKCWAFANTLIP